MNQDENATSQNLWNATKPILKGKFAHGHLSSQHSKPSPQENKEKQSLYLKRKEKAKARRKEEKNKDTIKNV